jgi:hypothetical protein
VSFIVCTQLWTEFFIFQISIRISDVLLHRVFNSRMFPCFVSSELLHLSTSLRFWEDYNILLTQIHVPIFYSYLIMQIGRLKCSKRRDRGVIVTMFQCSSHAF